MKAWLFQDSRQKAKLGDKCPWSVGWYDPSGKKASKTVGAKSRAEKYARRIEGQLAAGTYEGESRKQWADFRQECTAKIMPGLAPRTRAGIETILDHFERIAKPARMQAIRTSTIDDYVSTRRGEQGKKPGSKTSPATINRELRHLKAALRIAHEWKYLPAVPKFRRVREEIRVGRIITPEHFQAIYGACDVATMPETPNYPAGDWWRVLLAFAMTTGWRIEEVLSFRRDDLDLKTGAITTRAADNKGGRDEMDYLPAVVLDEIKSIADFGPLVFPWPHNYRTLWDEFQRIQKAAGIRLPCPDAERHECTEACHYYGFHALRRSYATMNAERMTGPMLQKKMRHRSFTTTLRYIGLADRMKKSADVVYVPDVLRKAAT